MSRQQPQDAGPFSMGSELFRLEGFAGAWPGAFGAAVIHALDPAHLWDSDLPIHSSMLWHRGSAVALRHAADAFGFIPPLRHRRAAVERLCRHALSRHGPVAVCALSTTRLPRTREDCVVCEASATFGHVAIVTGVRPTDLRSDDGDL